MVQRPKRRENNSKNVDNIPYVNSVHQTIFGHLAYFDSNMSKKKKLKHLLRKLFVQIYEREYRFKTISRYIQEVLASFFLSY